MLSCILQAASILFVIRAWPDISQRPTDTRTLIPFLKDMESHLEFKYSEIVADAGYESEENYLSIEANGQCVSRNQNCRLC